MGTTISEISCPLCGKSNNHLYSTCQHCNSRLNEYGLLLKRINALEQAGNETLDKKAYIDSLRIFSVLLEYKPQQTRYLKGLCKACIGLHVYDYAEDIINDLSSRLKNDKDLIQMKSEIEQRL